MLTQLQYCIKSLIAKSIYFYKFIMFSFFLLEKTILGPESDDEDDGEVEEVYDVVQVKNITIGDMHELNVEQMIPLSFEVLPRVLDLSGSGSGSGESDTETTFDLSITEIIDGSSNPVGETAYGEMKVDELRKIATDKNLATKDEIKKFKKPELLLLLKK